MNIAVCDDEIGFYKEVEQLALDYEKSRKVEIYTTYYESGETFPINRDFDIVFMDYQMKGLDGLETARKLREVNSECAIIFISAYPEIALDTFEVNTFRFIKKPVDKDKLFKALDDYLKSTVSENILKINTHDGIFAVKLSDIIYLESNEKNTMMRTVKDTIYIHRPLHYIESKLPSNRFSRCHKSFVANLMHVSNHSRTEVTFDNGEKAKIGRKYLPNFKEALQKYIIQFNEGKL